jgi:hypothetical protein
MSTATSGTHSWRFYRAGGVDQVLLANASDVLALDQLDQKLWVALACPVKGLEFDERTLQLLDSDNDGRVRAPELLGAIAWLKKVLREPQGLTAGTDGVPLSVIDDSTPEGKAVLAAAKHMLEGLGKGDAAAVTVGDATQTGEFLAKSRLNGDGVVPPDSIADPALQSAAQDVVALMGGEPDRSGKLGYTSAKLEAFYAKLTDYRDWMAEAEARAADILPLAAATPAAVAAVEAIAPKVDDWFLRGRLAAFDPRAKNAVNLREEVYLHAAARDLTVTAAELRQLPLALVDGGVSLQLTQGTNPAWQAEMDALRALAVEPILGPGKSTLTETEWLNVRTRLAAHRAWMSKKAHLSVDGLPLERVSALLDPEVRAGLERAIAEDLEAAPKVDAMIQVERLARLWRDLFRLLNNFVTFSDFYGRRKAIFQAGTLHLDARTTDLCVQVLDPAKHGTLAGKSGAYLAYVDCSRPGGEKMTLACAVTAGDSDNLFVGRNGLFYDRKGRDWDATISKIVDNPISVGQAFWSPYKKLVRWVEDTVAQRAAASDEAANAKLQGATAQTAAQATAAGQAAGPPPKPKFDVGVVAALGVAVGGITAAIGAMMEAIFGLGYLMPLGLLGLVLLISGPSMLIAWLKLHKRNLGPILDANGWAVNALTRVNIPLGRSLTGLAELPKGASRELNDPFAPKKSVWRWLFPLLVVLAVAGYLAWSVGMLSDWLSFVPRPAVQ